MRLEQGESQSNEQTSAGYREGESTAYSAFNAHQRQLIADAGGWMFAAGLLALPASLFYLYLGWPASFAILGLAGVFKLAVPLIFSVLTIEAGSALKAVRSADAQGSIQAVDKAMARLQFIFTVKGILLILALAMFASVLLVMFTG